MKLTRSWLAEFVELGDMSAERLVEVFESLGHEIEEWSLIEPSFNGVVIGRVEEVSAHPNADKVRLTKVDVGAETLEIICGAWNFEAGALVPVAVPGAVLDGDFEIVRRDIRGVTSNGMICSESELSLGEESDGIMVLNDDYPNTATAIGEPFEEILGFPDVYLDVNVTPNRPDCLSVYGLARDVAAYLESPLREAGVTVEASGPPSDVAVSISVPDQTPRFAGRQVRGITVAPSPHWLRWRLQQAGVRPISNVVDASNYAMIELGHPTHAFDVDRLGDQIDVRMAKDGETIETLDGQTRTLLTSDIVVTDGQEPVAVGGVMGGATTEVHEATTDVFIEAAYWNPASVLMTSKRLNLRSEASARFERGADPSACVRGADRVAQLLGEIAGGTAAADPVDENPGNIEPWTITYPLAETERILGIPLDAATTSDLLGRLGFGVTGTDPLTVTVPTRRPDVQRPVDLVEELARLHGFDSIPESVPQGTGHGLPAHEKLRRLIREIMVGAGFHETMTFSFIGDGDLDMLMYSETHPSRSGIRIVNPLNDAENVMRTTLLPGVLKAAAANEARRVPSTHLFEIGRVFIPGNDKLPDQPERLAFVVAGTPNATWLGEGVEPDVFDGTGIWSLLADGLGVVDASLTQASLPGFHPGRAAEVRIGDVVVGTIGEIHPRVAASFGLSGRVVGGEVDLAELLLDAGPWQFRPPSAFPPIIFDLAFFVPNDVAVSSFLASLSEAAGDFLEGVEVFDVFEGDAVDEGTVSIAVTITLRAADRTLSEADAAPIRQAIAAAVQDEHRAVLRGTV
ncbi:MAG: phenylalanine--tRNA ligase subunit beta [Acidimicrobiia bacterium]